MIPKTFFDGNTSAIAARARAAETLSAVLAKPAATPPGTVGLSANASGTLAGGGPRIFFLFMAYGGVNHMDLWSAFFHQAGAGRWRALVHCKDWEVCRLRLSVSNPFGVRLVDSVPSSYCADLVTPMVQLLRAATAESGHPGDKFVFLSDTTLPVKPFGVVYDTLTQNRYSDICVEPRSEWVWLTRRGSSGDPAALVKHSQWVVLNRHHARTLVERWPHFAGKSYGYWSVPVWPNSQRKGYDESDFSSVPHHSLCADEWAVFAALFGVVMSPKTTETVPGLSEPTLNLRGGARSDGQGVCRTFVTWGESIYRESSRVALKLSHMLSCYPDCHGSHPAHFTAMTDSGLQVLRSSSFLFARKFPYGVVSEDQFARIVLEPREPRLPWAS